MEETLLEHPLSCLLHWSKGKTRVYQEQSRIQGMEARCHEQRTGYSPKKKKRKEKKNNKKSNPWQIWHLGLQVEIPVAAAAALVCRDTEPLPGTGSSPALWEDPGDLGLLTNLWPSLWAQPSNPRQNFLHRNPDNLF